MIEIRTYIGVASACEGNTKNYPVGEKHAFNLFLLQGAGEQPNWSSAEETISNEGWDQIDIRKTGILSWQKVQSSQQPFPAMYKHALENGSALLVYRDPE